MAPTFGKGLVFEPGRHDWGVSIADGGVGYTASGRTSVPVMPGIDEQAASSMYGATVLPNMFIDLTGTVVIATRLQPRSATHTTIVTDYLFRREVVDDPDFDPTEVVEFAELVAHQDYAVCERAQLGVTSRAFEHGVYPEKDDLRVRLQPALSRGPRRPRALATAVGRRSATHGDLHPQQQARRRRPAARDLCGPARRRDVVCVREPSGRRALRAPRRRVARGRVPRTGAASGRPGTLSSPNATPCSRAARLPRR